MLNLRVRLVKDNGTTDGTSRVLNTKTISYAVDLNGAGTLDFSVSRNDFVPEVMPFLVRVEYSDSPSGPYKPLPEHELFIIESDSDDSLDEGQVVSYKAVAFVPWLLGGAYVGTGPGQTGNERQFGDDASGNASAGRIMSYLINESKGRGWLPGLVIDFSTYGDSNGVAWAVADRAPIKWTLETFYPKVLEQLSEQNMCDWTAEGNKLRLFRPGTRGSDRSQLVFGGAGFTRVPVTTDVTGWYTHVIALSDAGRVQVHNAAAEARFGRRSIAMTQTGIKDVPTSTKLARELLADGQKVKREEVFEWTPQDGGIYPFRDFILGDLVTAKVRGGSSHKRVFGVQVEQDIDGAKVQVRIGDQLKSGAIKAGKLLGSVTVGGVVGGSGGNYPSSPPLPLPVPLPPDGLRVTHNEGTWDSHGNPVVTVGLEWAKVTEAVDGSEVDIAEYQVWSREPAGERVLDATVAGISRSVEITSWAPDQHRLVSVRARAASGDKWSDYSLEVAVMPEYPAEQVPKAPTDVAEVSSEPLWTSAGPVDNIKLEWSPVVETTTGDPVEVETYEVWVGGVPALTTTTNTTTVQVPPLLEKEVRVRAYSRLGGWGDLSYPAITITGSYPAPSTATPTKPTVVSGSGNAFARWDGQYSGTTKGTLSVRVEARVGSGPWVVQGSLRDAGEQIVTLGNIGDTVEVRLVAVDQAGRVTGTSLTTTVVITGVDLGEIEQEIQDALDEISNLQEAITVEGGRLTWSANAPVAADAAGKPIGATWFRRDGAGVVIGQWELTTVGWVARTHGNQVIANLDAGKINTGFLASPRIQARSISAVKLALGDFTNLVNDGTFVYGNTEWPGATVVTSTTEPNYLELISGATGNTDAWNSAHFESTKGDEYFVSFEAWADPSNTVFRDARAFVSQVNDAGNNFNWPVAAVTAAQLQAAPGTWIKGSGVVFHNSDLVRSAKIAVSIGSTGGAVAGQKYRFRNVQVRRRNTAELIVDGAVKARHVTMDEGFANKFWANEANVGKIAVDYLEPNIGGKLNIWANEAVEIIVGRQDGQDADMVNIRDSVDVVSDAAAESERLAREAESAARVAEGQALVAQEWAKEAGDRIASQQAVFRVTSTGAEIASKDSSNLVQITPQGVTIVQGGAAASMWDAGRLIVSEAIVAKAQLGNHEAEKSGTQRTVFRPI